MPYRRLPFAEARFPCPTPLCYHDRDGPGQRVPRPMGRGLGMETGTRLVLTSTRRSGTETGTRLAKRTPTATSNRSAEAISAPLEVERTVDAPRPLIAGRIGITWEGRALPSSARADAPSGIDAHHPAAPSRPRVSCSEPVHEIRVDLHWMKQRRFTRQHEFKVVHRIRRPRPPHLVVILIQVDRRALCPEQPRALWLPAQRG